MPVQPHYVSHCPSCFSNAFLFPPKEGICNTYQVANNIKSQIIEPMQRIDFCVFLAAFDSSGGDTIPLFDELLQVVGHVLLELRDGLGAECMGDGFALAGVFGAIAGVEEAAVDGDKGVVIVTTSVYCELLGAIQLEQREHQVVCGDGVPFEPASAMRVDDRYSFIVRY